MPADISLKKWNKAANNIAMRVLVKRSIDIFLTLYWRWWIRYPFVIPDTKENIYLQLANKIEGAPKI